MVFTTLVTIGCVLGTPRGAEAEEHRAPEGGDSSNDLSAAIDRTAMYVLGMGWVGYNFLFFSKHLYAQSMLRLRSSYLGPSRRESRDSKARDDEASSKQGYQPLGDGAASVEGRLAA
jgi:hypothetical protein